MPGSGANGRPRLPSRSSSKRGVEKFKIFEFSSFPAGNSRRSNAVFWMFFLRYDRCARFFHFFRSLQAPTVFGDTRPPSPVRVESRWSHNHRPRPSSTEALAAALAVADQAAKAPCCAALRPAVACTRPAAPPW